jgi:nanoRNase/pAp phosphatase (c-di-AMP/oligoRNAs hydrolase)
MYVLYHANCLDGLGAKYSAWKKFGDQANYLAVAYNQPFPEIPEGSEVYILDFSYPKETLRNEHARAAKLLVIDHHKTAEENLQGEPYLIFDNTKSGAVLSWEYFHPEVEVPTLLKHIQDRDLWTWKLPGTRDILNFLRLHGESMQVLESFAEELETAPGRIEESGAAISDYQDLEINRAIGYPNIKFLSHWGNHLGNVALVNTTHLTSEIGNALCKSWPIDFAVVYSISSTGEAVLSFRSVGDFDVTPFAKELGGGGHRNSAGARISIQALSELYQQDL